MVRLTEPTERIRFSSSDPSACLTQFVIDVDGASGGPGGCVRTWPNKGRSRRRAWMDAASHAY